MSKTKHHQLNHLLQAMHLTETEKELLKRVANLEKIAEKLQSELHVPKNVSTLLSNEIDDLQQYQK